MNGVLVTSKIIGYKGNSIFIPAVGYYQDDRHFYVGSECLCWSSSLGNGSSESARIVYSDENDTFAYRIDRCFGLQIRPVFN